jgi:hypothetical protein
VPAINTNDMLNLPKGQAFAMIEGGQLYKLRLPLPEKEIFIKKSGITQCPIKLSIKHIFSMVVLWQLPPVEYNTKPFNHNA